mgnify:CR=1 FL=1
MEGNREYYPLTYPQRSVWVLDKLCPDTSIGVISATLKSDSDLDYELLQEAFNVMIQRNEGIRIRFTLRDGAPVQYVAPYEYYHLNFIDFRNKPIEELYMWDEQMSSIPYGQLDVPLFYFAVAKYNKHSTAIYTKVHHLISDAWSVVSIGNQIMEYYDLLSNGAEIPEEPLPSYLEYIKREKQYLASKKYANDERYWKEKYQDGLELTMLKPRKNTEAGFRAERKTFVVPRRLSHKIRQHCLDYQTSVFALFFSALCLYINRVTGKEEVTVGTPVLNRTNPREKEAIGMFISTVPLTVQITDDIDFKMFCKNIFTEWISVLKGRSIHMNPSSSMCATNTKERKNCTISLFPTKTRNFIEAAASNTRKAVGISAATRPIRFTCISTTGKTTAT